MTPAEVAVWERLRRSQLGVRFRRQHPIGRFIVDFVSLSHRLVIELEDNPMMMIGRDMTSAGHGSWSSSGIACFDSRTVTRSMISTP